MYLYYEFLYPGLDLASCMGFHKLDFASNFQLRLIFAAYNPASFEIDQYLVEVLAPFTTNDYTVDNSYVFSKNILSVRNASSYYMASFDGENLFTNVPLDETIYIYIYV